MRIRSGDFPDLELATKALAEAELVIAVDCVQIGVGRARSRGAPGCHASREARDHHEHRGSGAPGRPEADLTRHVLAGLDDRRRACGSARLGPRCRIGSAALGRDREVGSFARRAHACGARFARRQRRGGRAAQGHSRGARTRVERCGRCRLRPDRNAGHRIGRAPRCGVAGRIRRAAGWIERARRSAGEKTAKADDDAGQAGPQRDRARRPM